MPKKTSAPTAPELAICHAPNRHTEPVQYCELPAGHAGKHQCTYVLNGEAALSVWGADATLEQGGQDG